MAVLSVQVINGPYGGYFADYKEQFVSSMNDAAIFTSFGLTPANVTSVVGDALGLTFTFDQPVNAGSPSYTPPAGQGWTFTSIAQITAASIRADVGNVPPNLTRISATQALGRVRLTFDSPVAAPAPLLETGGDGWNLSGYEAPSSLTLDAIIDDVPPTLQSLVGDKTNGIDLVFDVGVDVGTPSFLQPTDAGWEFSGTATQVAGNRIRIGIDDIATGGVSLRMFNSGVRLLTLDFTDTLIVAPHGLDPTSWVLTTTAPGAVSATVTAVNVVGNIIYLTTTECTDGKNYTLSIPGTDIEGSTGDVYTGPTSYPFTAKGDKPIVIQSRVVDDNNIDLIFNEDVTVESATNPANYSFNPYLQVTRVARRSASVYRLTVVGKRTSQLYDLTVTGIVDLANNSI